MHTIEHLRQLFAYNDWANRRVITGLKAKCPEKALSILTHLLITEKEYFERLYGKDSKGFDFWPAMTLPECGALARETAERYEKLLRRFEEEGLDLTARYRTSEGRWCENTYREMLTHVLFHSSIHRGNIILNMRESEIDPPSVDYIVFLRETVYI